MAGIEVRLAGAHDRAAMLEFLAAHWRADHIFVLAPEVFDWQYRRMDGDYNVVLATQGETVLGFLGFIPTGQFDPALGQSDILLAIWKVREDLAPPGLGIRMLKLIEKQKPATIGAIGISDMVEPIYRAFRYTVDRLHHCALFTQTGGGSVAQNIPAAARAPLPAPAPGWRLGAVDQVMDQVDVLAANGPGLRKSAAYLKTRYIDHPWYSYTICGVFQSDTLRCVLVWRRVEAQGAALLRIVDIIGPADGLPHVAPALRDAVEAAGADYIDLMQTGLDPDLLRAAGFVSPDDHPDLVLPNYFAPFEARNIEIRLSYRAFGDPDRRLTLYRADSDQDRPNQRVELTQKTG